MQLLQIALQTDDGIFLPEDGASTVVWVIFAAIVAALYWTITRTRRRAEQELWDRKRREKEERTRPEPEDPSTL